MTRVYLHPLTLRIWHWANAVLVIILVATGIQLRLSGMAAQKPHSFALELHGYAGWVMVFSFLFWLTYSIWTGSLRRHYLPGRRDLRGIFVQAEYYLVSLFRGEENPFRPSPADKFNALQKLAYLSVMCFFVPLLVFSGILLSDPAILRKYVLLLNAALIIDLLHVIGAYAVALYLLVHVYMSTIGATPLSHTKAMILGYEEEPPKSEAEARECHCASEGSPGSGREDGHG